MAPQDPGRGLVGVRVGQYRVLREIGRGGMGVVYEAVHEVIGQRAAIKVLAAGEDEPRRRERFLAEARAASAVRHPGLVSIFDFGQLEDGRPYLLMELLEGESLRARLQRAGAGQPLPLPEAARIARQVAAALAAAHERRIVHRDLKPDNVLLVPDAEARPFGGPGGARARLLDFGVAKFLDEEGRTPGGVVVGTARYMAPEQGLGAERVGERADVYALGVVLYEMAAGRPPFDGDRATLVSLHAFEDPAPLRSVAPAAPPALEALLQRMLAKPPALRPSMMEVAAALRPLEALPEAAAGPRGAAAETRTAEAPAVRPRAGEGSAPVGEVPDEGVPARAPAEPERCGRPPERAASRRTGARFRLVTLGAAALVLAAGAAALRSPALRRQGGAVRLGGRFPMGSGEAEVEAAFRWSRRQGCASCDRALYEREQPRREVEVSPFLLDRTEVTNEDLAAWLDRQRDLKIVAARSVRQGGALLVDLWPDYNYGGVVYQSGHFRARPGFERLPAVLVTWTGALRYCRDRGARLPTEAEWELAARGAAGRRFPWGDAEPRCEGVRFGRLSGAACERLGQGPAPVGSAAQDVTPEGVRDLGGNVAEWVMDRFLRRYPACGAGCRDPLYEGPSDDKEQLRAVRGGGWPEQELRVVRGGAWFRAAEACRGAGRSRWGEEAVSGDVGFRCARPARP